MQAWPLSRKIQVTQTRIIEWYQKWHGQVYISFSGGKDSTVLLDLARHIYPDIPAVFCDTGLEYPEIREFVKTKENVVWLRPKMSFRKVIETYGYPIGSKEISQKIYDYRRNPMGYAAGSFDADSDHIKKYGKGYLLTKWIPLRDSDYPVSHQCCNVMKKQPAKLYEKETGRKPIIATMTCESHLRKTVWMKHGCNAFDAKRPTSQPMSFWTERDVLEYLSTFDIPYASVYGNIIRNEDGTLQTTGCDRTGCIFCGFGCHLEKEPNRFQKLKQTHPKLWEYCMKPWDSGGLGMKDVLAFIGVKTE